MVLAEIADKFAGQCDRDFAARIPMLNAGARSLAELREEAEKRGVAICDAARINLTETD